MRLKTAPPILIVLALWMAGLGAAAQFGKMSVIYDQLGAVYLDQRGVGIGVLVSMIGIIGLIFGTTAGALVARIGPKRATLYALAIGALISLFQSFLPAYPWMLASRVPEGLSGAEGRKWVSHCPSRSWCVDYLTPAPAPSRSEVAADRISLPF